MKKLMKKMIVVLFIIINLVFISTQVYSHSGRTDANGGHKDNKNVSGLGSYHYHCGGHPAHLHDNGICPYSESSQTDINTMSSQEPEPISEQNEIQSSEPNLEKAETNNQSTSNNSETAEVNDEQSSDNSEVIEDNDRSSDANSEKVETNNESSNENLEIKETDNKSTNENMNKIN